MSTAVTGERHTGGGARAPKATARQWLGLTIMVVPLFMLATDVTALYLAMPAISADLAPTGSQSLWILHIGEFLTAATMITFGLLTRRIGARRLLLGAVAAYGLASLTAAFAADAEMLILARAVLGVGAAAFTPAGLVMIRTTFQDDRQYGIAFALFMAAFSGGMAAGPPFGGFILEHFWWGTVFLINVPIAAVLLLSGPLLLPRNHADRTVRIDLASVLLSVAAILALVYGMQEIAASGPDPISVASAVLGMILVLVFLRRQARTVHPLLDLSLFHSRVFSGLLVVLFLVMLGTMFVDMLMAQHLQMVRGLSPWEAGLVLLAPAVAATVGTAAAPLADRGGPVVGGLLLGIGGAAGLMLALRLPESGVVELAALLAVTMLMAAPYITLLSQRLIGAAPVEKTGSATALQEVAASLGGASSIALMGAGALMIHRTVLGSAAPGSLDPEVVDAAGESFGAAPAAAVGLEASDADALLHAADAGLTAATQAGYLVFSLVVLLTAVGIVVFGRRFRG
ncbi:MFS transporter [Nesterenkonia sp. HG001]|uniref:MFS transporter n=1 Tax=Nesterenkonia sp. HG001 TaxID=2983207 RepID=UPI002AC3CD07|nr:MFS transporter [Nesterenkonia sp. HG001]MDZ5077056.1 MFS transporter [Nesterenkonia sp. HG001]